MEWILFLRCLILFAISPAWFSRDKRNRQCTQWSLHGTLVQKYTEEIWFKNAKRKTFNSHLKNLLKDKNIFQPPSCWKKKKRKEHQQRHITQFLFCCILGRLTLPLVFKRCGHSFPKKVLARSSWADGGSRAEQSWLLAPDGSALRPVPHLLALGTRTGPCTGSYPKASPTLKGSGLWWKWVGNEGLVCTTVAHWEV